MTGGAELLAEETEHIGVHHGARVAAVDAVVHVGERHHVEQHSGGLHRRGHLQRVDGMHVVLILLRERGMGILDAAVAAARSRLRPILMTTLTTVLGMIPMAIGTGEGSEMWRSLGITVAWGLSVSTVVTLVLIPTIYCVFATRQEKRKQKKLARKAAALNA